MGFNWSCYYYSSYALSDSLGVCVSVYTKSPGDKVWAMEIETGGFGLVGITRIVLEYEVCNKCVTTERRSNT